MNGEIASVNVFIFYFRRASESLLPPVTRSLSVPDSGSVWEMQNPSSQASCTTNLQQAAQSSEFLSLVSWSHGNVCYAKCNA